MNVLGMDGALGGFSVAVLRDGADACALEAPGNLALEQGLALVEGALKRAGTSFSALDRIGVGVGPGGFTGVRIAISYAKSLALGWRLPLAGIDSFDALEAGLQRDPSVPLFTVVPGRRNVISARLSQGSAGLRASGYVADVLDLVCSALTEPKLSLVGDAEGVAAALGERGLDVKLLHRVIQPSALAVATVAAVREPAGSLHEVRADYGELPAAKLPK